MRTACKRRISTTGLLVVLVGVVLPLLGPGAAAQDAAGEKVLRIRQTPYPETADPQKSSFSTEIAFLVQNYEGLTRLDANLGSVPAAAERWEFSADGTTITFHLRGGLSYSDGSPLTAERFVDAALRTCDPTTAGDYQHILFDIVGCADFAGLYAAAEGATPVAADDTAAFDAARAAVGVAAPDDRTVEVRLTQPAPYFPQIAGLWVFFPAKQELIERGGDAWWQDPALQVGNGPFQVTRMEPDELIEMVANERYWAGRPKLDGIELVYVPDSAVALEAYEAGDLHIMRPDPNQLDAIAEDPALSRQLIRVAGASTFMLTLNLQQTPFDDKKVREAFAYAFDRETFCAEIRGGDCVPSLSWVPPGVAGHIESDAYAYDPAKAVQALAESSYGGPEALPEITYTYVSDDPAERDRSEWIAGHYRDVLGVELELQPLEGKAWVALITDPDNTPQMTFLGWFQDYPDPQNWLSVVWACEAIFAVPAGYCNPAFDELVGRADRELDPAARIPLYEEAERLLLADVPFVILGNQANVFLVKPEVSGYTLTATDVEWPGLFASMRTIDLGAGGGTPEP